VDTCPDTKRCIKCGIAKLHSEFRSHTRMSDGLQSTCRACERENSRRWYRGNRNRKLKQQKAWIRNHPNFQKDLRSQYREEWVCFLRSIVGNLECVDCGERCWDLLCFHHRDPDDKVFKISDFVPYHKPTEKNKELLIEEVKKCDILCKGCHTRLHNYLRELSGGYYA
jgi:hypothetical protein